MTTENPPLKAVAKPTASAMKIAELEARLSFLEQALDIARETWQLQNNLIKAQREVIEHLSKRK